MTPLGGSRDALQPVTPDHSRLPERENPLLVHRMFGSLATGTSETSVLQQRGIVQEVWVAEMEVFENHRAGRKHNNGWKKTTDLGNG
jgi:hypothetical protein